MKFAVKALVMGLSANAVKLEQRASTYPYAYTAPYAYNTWSTQETDWASPDWGVADHARYTHAVPECHECEE